MTAEAWIAGVGVVISAIFALMARRDAGKAEKAAEEARGSIERQAVAQERLAAIAEERLQSIKATGGLPPGTPDVGFELDYYSGDTWVLRNIGTKEATGVRIEGAPAITRNVPDGISLGPLRSHKFLMAGAMQSPVPHEVTVFADQLTNPVPLPVPPKPKKR